MAAEKPIECAKMAEICKVSTRMMQKWAVRHPDCVVRKGRNLLFYPKATLEARAGNDPIRGGKRNVQPEGAVSDDDLDPIGVSQQKIAHWRARYGEVEAALADIELQRKSGVLVLAEDERKDAFRVARAFRDRMMNIPDRLSSTLAAETEAAQVHIILTREIRDACAELAALNGGEA